MQNLDSDGNLIRLPIRELSEKTGVGTSTLRAWERRYGLLAPERTPKGHRLYSLDDVRLIQRVLTLLEEGHSLPAIASKIKPSNESLGVAVPVQTSDDIWSEYLHATLLAIEEFSTERLESIFNEASSIYPVDLVTERLIEPVLLALGSRWQDRELGIAEEHFYSNWLRNRIGARFHHAIGQAQGARIICAGIPGAHHEIGLLLFSLMALSRGYRVLYLGVDLPLEQVPLVVRQSASRGVVLACRNKVDESLHASLAQLSIDMDVPVMLGGMCGDEPLDVFEQAGGIRLGARVSTALKVLATHVPAFSGGYR